MKYPVFLLLWCVLPALSAAGQTDRQRDSLLNLIHTADHDTARVLALKEAGRLYLNGNLDSAALFFNQALALAERVNFEKGIAQCRVNLAYAAIDQGRFTEAVAQCEKAIPLCEKLHLYKELAAAYNNLGNAWNFQGNAWLAINSYEKSLAAMDKAEMPPQFPIAVRNNLSMLCNDLCLYDKALASSRQAYTDAQAIRDELSMGVASQHLANAYKGLNRETEALAAYRHASELARRTEHELLLATSLGNEAGLLNERGQWEQALDRYNEALAIGRANEDLISLTYNLHGLSLLYFDRGQYSLAQSHARQSLELARQANLHAYIHAIYLTLSDLALVQGDQKNWSTYRDLYVQARDSVANNALVHALQELETRYETGQKEQQISLLRQEGEIQSLRLQRRNNALLGLSGFALLLVLSGSLGYRNLRHGRRLDEQELTISQQRIRELEHEKQLSTVDAMLRGQEEERGRLARDLHDGLGGQLSGIKQTLFAMKGNQILPESSAHALSRVIDDIDQSIRELRHIARNMMPEALVRFGLKDALRDYCDHIREATGLALHFQAFQFDERLPESVEVVLFRIGQELLNNVVKHAEARQVLVQLVRDERRVSLTVEDDGRGFDAEQLRRAPGIGWLNIRSRAEYLNGTLDLHTLPGRGTSVHIEIPLS